MTEPDRRRPEPPPIPDTYRLLDDFALPVKETSEPNGQPNRVPPAEQPMRMGDFEILEELARSGVGVVFKARQVSLDRVVALKMILPSRLGSPGMALRFRQEAEAAARLDHPGIVRIFEVGEHEGLIYVAMAFVEGESLAERLRRGPLAPREAAALLRETTAAVQHAHEHGVIHRDLKPANILVGSDGKPRVTDFGLARFQDGSTPSADGDSPAIPAYLAPEQAGGGNVGPAADIHGLGAVLYALLTGVPPFRAPSVQELLSHVRRSEPVPPSKLNRRVDRDLEMICLKCLEKEASRRYRKPFDLMADLLRWLNHRPIKARTGGRLRRWWLWCRRDPQALALAAAVLIGVLGPVLWNWRGDEAQNQKAWEVLQSPGGDPQLYAAAAQRCERLYQKSPDHPEYRVRLGVARFREGRFAEAIDLLAITEWREPDADRTQKLQHQAGWYASLASYRVGQFDQAFSGMASLRGPFQGEAEGLLADARALLPWLDGPPRQAALLAPPRANKWDGMDFGPAIGNDLGDDDIAWVFRQLGPRILEIVPEMLKRGTHPNARVRYLAQYVLVHAVLTPELVASEPGRQVLDHVIKALASPAKLHLAPQTVVPRLGALGAQGRPAGPVLIDLYLEKNKLVPAADVKEALGQIDPNWMSWPEARQRLARLIAALRDGDDQARQNAGKLVPRFGKAAVPSLIEILDAGKSAARNPAIKALGEIGPDAEPAVSVLKSLLLQPATDAAEPAADALARIGKAAIPALTAAAGHDDPAVRSLALRSLQTIGVPAVPMP